ncbi:hypothetical protein CoNPh26_CDS0063 [Staphylococcus phage S-CoN_Ph26]|nr:hypothetical protein CoNPh26_CDS0063 [Staphylococcus phage S-CoN_Ph26]
MYVFISNLGRHKLTSNKIKYLPIFLFYMQQNILYTKTWNKIVKNFTNEVIIY